MKTSGIGWISSIVDRAVVGSSARLALLILVWLVSLYQTIDALEECRFRGCDYWLRTFWPSRERELEEFVPFVLGLDSAQNWFSADRLTLSIWLITAASYFWVQYLLTPANKGRLKERFVLAKGGPMRALLLSIPIVFILYLAASFLWDGVSPYQYGAKSGIGIVTWLGPFVVGFVFAYATGPEPGPSVVDPARHRSASAVAALLLTLCFWWFKPESAASIQNGIDAVTEGVLDKRIAMDRAIRLISKDLRDGWSSGYRPTAKEFFRESHGLSCEHKIMARALSVQGEWKLVTPLDVAAAEESERRLSKRRMPRPAGQAEHCADFRNERTDAVVQITAQLCAADLLTACP